MGNGGSFGLERGTKAGARLLAFSGVSGLTVVKLSTNHLGYRSGFLNLSVATRHHCSSSIPNFRTERDGHPTRSLRQRHNARMGLTERRAVLLYGSYEVTASRLDS